MESFINFDSTTEGMSSCSSVLDAGISRTVPGYERRRGTTSSSSSLPSVYPSIPFHRLRDSRDQQKNKRSETNLSDWSRGGPGWTSQEFLDNLRPLIFLLMVLMFLLSVETHLTEAISFRYVFQM